MIIQLNSVFKLILLNKWYWYIFNLKNFFKEILLYTEMKIIIIMDKYKQ